MCFRSKKQKDDTPNINRYALKYQKYKNDAEARAILYQWYGDTVKSPAGLLYYHEGNNMIYSVSNCWIKIPNPIVYRVTKEGIKFLNK